MNLNKIKNIAKNILAIPFIRKFKNGFTSVLYTILSVGKVLAIPFHFIFSRAFDREIFAYTTAVHHYNKKISQAQPSNVLIRRNIHRLEKGLIMENRRPVFALDYIEETVECYAMILQQTNSVDLELGELQWAYNVLSEYFRATDASNAIIGRQKRNVRAVTRTRGHRSQREIHPLPEQETPPEQNTFLPGIHEPLIKKALDQVVSG